LLPPLTVLVTEDNVVNRTLIVRILQKHGHRVKEARDGLQALQALERGGIDVVLLDLEMPRLGGIETTRRIREIEKDSERHLPIVALTAHAMPGDRERCLNAGMDGYVAKPIRRSTLFSAIAAAIPEVQLRDTGTATARPDPPGDAREGLDELFVRNSRRELCEIRDALQRDDRAAAKRIAHGMAGAAGVVGAREIGILARDLERVVESEDLPLCDATCDDLARALDEFAPRDSGETA